MFTIIYCIQPNLRYLVANAIKHKFLKSYYHVYHMPSPSERFKASPEFAK